MLCSCTKTILLLTVILTLRCFPNPSKPLPPMGAGESSQAHPLCAGERHPRPRGRAGDRTSPQLGPAHSKSKLSLLAESKVRLLAAENSEEMRSRLISVFDPKGLASAECLM